MRTSGNGLLKRLLHKFFVTDVKASPFQKLKPIGNRLVKSVTDQCPVGSGLFKFVTITVVLVTGFSVRYR
jgi:hypothetical protein